LYGVAVRPLFLQIGRLVLNRNPTNYFAEVRYPAYIADTSTKLTPH
jgi:catalase